jgi:hypothetical protein
LRYGVWKACHPVFILGETFLQQRLSHLVYTCQSNSLYRYIEDVALGQGSTVRIVHPPVALADRRLPQAVGSGT